MHKQVLSKLYAIYSEGVSANCYLLTGKKTVLIDSGHSDNEENLKNSFKALGLKFSDVKLILHTHGHIDHFSADYLFPNAELYMHEYDAQLVNLKDAAFTASNVLPAQYFPTIKLFFSTNQIFNFSPFNLEVFFTPGHTKGSVCFYDKKLKLLFSGDTIFNQAFGRYDLPSGSKSELLASLKKLKPLNFNILLPGHNSIRKEKQKENIDFAIEMLSEISE